MRVISVRPLREFWSKRPDAETSLRHWIKATESATWKTFAEVRVTFGSADSYRHFTIFNIGGNKYRLIAKIEYQVGHVYVRHILTHLEYDKGRWKV
jgi:mRNA interferase HigB